MTDWNDYPYNAAEFAYPGNTMESNWPDLHRGDCVQFPDKDWVHEWLELVPQSAPAGFDGDVDGIASGIQSAWRHFHAGDFQLATDLADQYGPLAHACANKATGIYATYLPDDESVAQGHFQEAIARAERAIELLSNDANTHYFRAFNLGRYGQSISILY